MKPIHIILVILLLLARYSIVYVDLFLVMFFTLYYVNPTERTKTIHTFILLAFVYSFLKDSILGLFPMIFIAVVLLFHIIMNRVPKSGTMLSVLTLIFIQVLTLGYATLQHLLQYHELLFFESSIWLGLGTTAVTFILSVYFQNKHRRI